ncbi:hypothetical protein CERSUDRAFT_26886, partial [Gelatoporia subvermispora B]
MMPFPEVLLPYINMQLRQHAWNWVDITRLSEMTEDLPYGFIAFYGKASKDGHAFPLNQNIQSIQQNKFNKASAWRGDIIVAKYTDAKFSNMQHISMADWPVLKNFFQTH